MYRAISFQARVSTAVPPLLPFPPNLEIEPGTHIPDGHQCHPQPPMSLPSSASSYSLQWQQQQQQQQQQTESGHTPLLPQTDVVATVSATTYGTSHVSAASANFAPLIDLSLLPLIPCDTHRNPSCRTSSRIHKTLDSRPVPFLTAPKSLGT
jgi:hypothetical protein